MDKTRYLFPCPACKRPAFEYSHLPAPGDVIMAKDAIQPKAAKRPEAGDSIVCQFCGETLFNPLNAERFLVLPSDY